jgi:hypothetical protein
MLHVVRCWRNLEDLKMEKLVNDGKNAIEDLLVKCKTKEEIAELSKKLIEYLLSMING